MFVGYISCTLPSGNLTSFDKNPCLIELGCFPDLFEIIQGIPRVYPSPFAGNIWQPSIKAGQAAAPTGRCQQPPDSWRLVHVARPKPTVDILGPGSPQKLVTCCYLLTTCGYAMVKQNPKNMAYQSFAYHSQMLIPTSLHGLNF